MLKYRIGQGIRREITVASDHRLINNGKWLFQKVIPNRRGLAECLKRWIVQDERRPVDKS